MAITIEMIEEKEFQTVSRGYDPEEVDEFLDEIVDEMEAMLDEIDDLRAAQEELQARPPQVENLPAPAPAPRSDIQEESIRNMLLNAQRVSDDTIADAKKRAQEILLKANQQAEAIVSDARTEQQQLVEEMDTLRAAAKDYRERFKRLLEDQEHLMKAETHLYSDL